MGSVLSTYYLELFEIRNSFILSAMLMPNSSLLNVQKMTAIAICKEKQLVQWKSLQASINLKPGIKPRYVALQADSLPSEALSDAIGKFPIKTSIIETMLLGNIWTCALTFGS